MTTNARLRARSLAFALCAAIVLLASTGCWWSVRVDRPHAVVHTGGSATVHYNWVYYPDVDVYYSPSHRCYYYYSSGNWVYSSSLPGHIHIHSGGVHIDFHGAHPYSKYHHHRSHYRHHPRTYTRTHYHESRNNYGHGGHYHSGSSHSSGYSSSRSSGSSSSSSRRRVTTRGRTTHYHESRN